MIPVPGVLVIESADADHVVAAFNPLLVAVFTAAPSAAALALIERRAAEAVDAGIRGGILYVVARQRIVGGLDTSVREAFARMVRRNESRAGASAVVLLTQGFAAAIARLAAMSILALVRRRGAVRVFDDLDEACRWLTREHALAPDALRQAFAEATKHLDLGRGR